jgi:hypothetical protein
VEEDVSAKTYKFLAKGALGPLSGFTWPTPSGGHPGAWVEEEGPLELCARGLHVCRTIDLAHWLHDELWELEVDGEPLAGVDCLVFRRARLLRRIDAWQEGAAMFTEASVEHARTRAASNSHDTVRGLLADAQWAAGEALVAVSAYAAALAVATAARPSERKLAYRAERAWQAGWIAREMIGARTTDR